MRTANMIPSFDGYASDRVFDGIRVEHDRVAASKRLQRVLRAVELAELDGAVRDREV